MKQASNTIVMKDPLSLFEKIQKAPPRKEVRVAVLQKIEALKKDRFSVFQVATMAAGLCFLLATSLYLTIENKQAQAQQTDSVFLNQNDIYE